jgi:hypothetical protein
MSEEEIDYTEYLQSVEDHNRNLQAEIEQLKFLNAEERATIDELAKLLTRAADALEVYLPTAAGGTKHPFIAELRKAAE